MKAAITGLALVLLAAPSAAQDDIPWIEKYDEGFQSAKEKGKLVVLYFWASWSKGCRDMDLKTFTDDEVIKLSNERFVYVRLDAVSEREKFRALTGGRVVPATCILAADEELLSVMLGPVDAKMYLKHVRGVLEGYEELSKAKAAAAKSPDDPAAWHVVGHAYDRLERWDRSEEAYAKAVEAADKAEKLEGEAKKVAALSHERLARLRAMTGKIKEARHHLNRYRELDPENALQREDNAAITEAAIFGLLRAQKEAAELMEEALAKYKESDEADMMLFMLGSMYHQMGDHPRALAGLERLAKEHPKSIWTARSAVTLQHLRASPLLIEPPKNP